MTRVLLTTATAAAALALGAPAALAQPVEAGAAAAVNALTRGTPPAGETRIIEIGSDVYRFEQIVTDAAGQAQLLFLDGSALTVGPSSQVVIDSFVYDPDARTGRLALSATSGIFRFVGGALSKDGGVSVETPTATIGIRGGAFVFQVDPGTGATATSHLFGELQQSCGGVEVTITRAGFGSTCAAPDQPPSPPGRQPVDMAAFESTPGETGGSTEPPTDDTVADAGVDQANSALPVDQVAVLASAPPVDPGPPPSPGAIDEASEQTGHSQDQLVDDLNPPPPPAGGLVGRWTATPTGLYDEGWTGDHLPDFGQPIEAVTVENGIATITLADGSVVVVPYQPGGTVGLGPDAQPVIAGDFSFGPSGTQSPYGPLAGRGFVAADESYFFYQVDEVLNVGERQLFFGGVPYEGDFADEPFRAYAVLPDFDLGSAIPFIRTEGGGAIADPVVSPLVFATRQGADPDAVSVGGVAAIAITGEGAYQQSVIMGATLLVEQGPAGNTLIGGRANASARLGGDAPVIRSTQGLGAVPAGEVAFVAPEAQSPSVPSANNGIFGGDDPSFFVLGALPYGEDPVTVEYGTEGSIGQPGPEARYNAQHPALEVELPPGLEVTRTTRTLNGYAAGFRETHISGEGEGEGTSYGYPVRSLDRSPAALVIQTDAATNRVSAEMALAEAQAYGYSPYEDEVAAELRFGNPVGAAADRGAFIDDSRFVMREQGAPGTLSSVNGAPAPAGRGTMFSHQAAPLETLPGGAAPCECQYLEWGWWSFSDGQFDASVQAQRSDEFHAGTWVAGTLPTEDIENGTIGGVDVETLGTVTYAGHAIANISNNGTQYIAGGSFSNTFDFGDRQGYVTIEDLDGRDYVGTVAGLRDYRSEEPLIANDGQIQMLLTGSFFSGGGDPVAETGGIIELAPATEGIDYYGAGTFAGTRQQLSQ